MLRHRQRAGHGRRLRLGLHHRRQVQRVGLLRDGAELRRELGRAEAAEAHLARHLNAGPRFVPLSLVNNNK